MKMNRKLVLIVSLVLSLALATGGTLAYLQDTDADVNVMTLGNVHIEQHEYERVVNDEGEYTTDTFDGVTSYVLQEFTQGKPLLPATEATNFGAGPYDGIPVRMSQVDSYGGASVFTTPLAVDKFVTVENTGKSDAYVRTLIAFEMGELTATEWDQAVRTEIRADKAGEGAQPWKIGFHGQIQVDGENYYVYELIYVGAQTSTIYRHENGVLPAGDTTYPSLCQVYMTAESTNETVEKIDGNGNGTYDILVVSQAVQAAGFESAEVALNTAFGDVTTTSHPWMDGEEGDQEPDELPLPGAIYSYDDITAIKATANASGSYYIANDLTADNIVFFGNGSDITLDLNNMTITAGNTNQFVIGAQKGAKLHLVGDGVVNAGKGFMANKENAEIVIDGGTYNGTVTTTLKVDDEIITFISLAQNSSSIVINGGTFTTDVDNAALFFATSNATIEVNGGFFENTADSTPDLFSMGINKYNTNRIIFKGGTFVNWNPLDDQMCYTGEWPESYEQFSGPRMLVWDGYKVVSETQENGDVWYSVVPE